MFTVSSALISWNWSNEIRDKASWSIFNIHLYLTHVEPSTGRGQKQQEKRLQAKSLLLGLYRIPIWPDIRQKSKFIYFLKISTYISLVSPKPVHISGRYILLFNIFWTFSEKVCLFEVCIMCSTIYPNIRLSGHLNIRYNPN